MVMVVMVVAAVKSIAKPWGFTLLSLSLPGLKGAT